MAELGRGSAEVGASVAVAWLDGGPETHGWFASEVMEEVSGETRGALDVLDRKWREDPSAVWIGWLTYEFGRAHGRTGAARLPALCMRKYANATRLAPGQTPASVAASVADTDSCWWPLSPLQPTLAPDEFRRRVSAAKELIARGDTYQVNLSQEFRAAYESSICDPGSRDEAWLRRMALRLFASLRDRAPASMGGLIQAEGAWIVSNSPERLLSVSLGAAGSPDVACSSPIKGTRRRGADAGEDAAAIEELCGCDKERAEHVMIVDLVRNDLGRCARPGTVRTSPTPRVVSLPTVHHLVTDVECELRRGWDLGSLVDAVFPGGSVTGAPKRRTMEIIEGLEEGRREIYCGALVVLHPGGLDMSIPIRTGVLDKEGLWLRSGGGIVADSDSERERIETITKTLAFDPRRHLAPNGG